MNPIVILLVLLLIFGWGGFAIGGPRYGGSGVGLILVVILILWVAGYFRD